MSDYKKKISMTYQQDNLRGVLLTFMHQLLSPNHNIREKWCLSAMDNVCFEVKVLEMYFPTIWRSKFTDLINSEKTQSLGKSGCRQKFLDKSLISHIRIFCFPFSVSYKQNKNVNEVFHIKSQVCIFHFCHQ